MRSLGRSHQVTVVNGVASAAALLEEETFDCVLSDYAFADGHGTDILALCERRSPHTRRVLLTALIPQLSEAEQRPPTVQCILKKPCDLKDLLAAISEGS
jgi:DNA-binding NtrC family response regulator